jgi:hypothetical protein
MVLRKIFGSKRDDVTGGWRNYIMTSSRYYYDITSSRMMRWAGDVARMGRWKIRTRFWRRSEDSIKMDLRDVRSEDTDWINLA